MFEKIHEPVASPQVFACRFMKNIIYGILLVLITLTVGMLGVHKFEGAGWIESFNCAAMILSTVGPDTPFVTPAGKIFAGVYSLFCGLAILSIFSIIFAPVLHRFLHKFHSPTE